MKASQGPFYPGVRNHVSAPKRNTNCTTALKKCPDIFGYAPSRIKILDIRPQLFIDFCELPATARQLSSPAVITLPRYLNVVTFFKGFP